MTTGAPNIPPDELYADARGENRNPVLRGLSEAERDAYVRVTDWLARNPELTELAACKKTLVDFELYCQAKRKAVAKDGEAFSFHEKERIRRGDKILGGKP